MKTTLRAQIRVLSDCYVRNTLIMKLESVSFRDSFDVLLEKRLRGVAELRHTMLYGKSQIEHQI